MPLERDVYKMKFRIYYEEFTNQTEAFFMFQVLIYNIYRLFPLICCASVLTINVLGQMPGH